MQHNARKLRILHGEVWRIEPVWQSRLAAVDITAQTRWSEYVGGELISQSQHVTACYRCELPDGGSLYFERDVYARRHRFDFWMRPAKSAVECWAYSRLRALGIPTLDVLAFGEQRRFGMLQAGCIVTRGISDAVDIATFAETIWCH